MNWSSLAAPNGPSDLATFGVSSTTSVFLSANTEVDSIVFNPSASAYTITATATRILRLSGAGVVNNSGVSQMFVANVDSSGGFGTIVVSHNATLGSSISLTSRGSIAANQNGGVITFLDNAAAADAILFANGGATSAGNGGTISFLNMSNADHASLTLNPGAVTGANPPRIQFFDSSSASRAAFTNNGAVFGGVFDVGGEILFHNDSSGDAATFTNNGGTVLGAGGGAIGFLDNSTAKRVSIINNGGRANGAFGAVTGFTDNATAADSVIVNNGGLVAGGGGGRTAFIRNATAAGATLIANAGPGGSVLDNGQISFEDNSKGGTARIVLFGGAFLNIRQHAAPGVTIGSLEGTGMVYLGSNTLTIGSNNRSTEFSGMIQYGGPFGPDPVGGSVTKIGSGTLILGGQNTYTGQTTVLAGTLTINGSVVTPVAVNAGTLGGSGTTGAVSINSGATLAPGSSTGILHVAGNLTLSLGATYLVELNGVALGTQYDQTSVAGVVALGDATLSLSLGFQPAVGMIFTIIDNDGADAITGAFSGLPEGATFAVDASTFRISYHGGDGNDVVLETVPEPRTAILFVLGGAILVRLSCRA